MPEAFPKRPVIATWQLEQLGVLWQALLPANRFYAQKFARAGLKQKIDNLQQFTSLVPFTTKAELAQDQQASPPYGTNLCYPLDRYTRCHQTSGTSGQPLRWLDTPESWQAMLANWEQILRVAGVESADRVYFAFSFGPFIGFWLAFEAALKMGCLCLPGGGLSTTARLSQIIDQGASVLCCTPTYAIHLGETAQREKLDISRCRVKRILVAGEPGGSIPATRARIEELWLGAAVFDHHGMTEVGPVTFQCPARTGVLHVMEHAFIAEVIDPGSGRAAAQGEAGELVLTTLTRLGSPLLRYRTSDLVRASGDPVCACGRSELAFEGGILGRCDDMVVIRGVNVYPTAVEQIIRNVGGIAEYRVHLQSAGALAELEIEIEPEPTCSDPALLAHAIVRAFQDKMSLRVTARPAGKLPRFEMKAHRWVRH